MEPVWNEWYVLTLLYDMNLTDGTPLAPSLITFGELKNGMVSGLPDKYGKMYNGGRILLFGTVYTAEGGCICSKM